MGRIEPTSKNPLAGTPKAPLGMMAVFFGVLLPLLLLVLGIIIFTKGSIFNPLPPQRITEEGGEYLTPSEVLNDKTKYTQKQITIRGRVFMEPVICQRQSCPEEDQFCGCPLPRSLEMTDSGTIITSKTKGRMELLDANKKPLCQRRPSTNQYDCSGWTNNAIYDVTGTFYAEAAPPGMNISLDYYFIVEGKNLVREVEVQETASNVFTEIKKFFEGLKTSGSYVMP